MRDRLPTVECEDYPARFHPASERLDVAAQSDLTAARREALALRRDLQLFEIRLAAGVERKLNEMQRVLLLAILGAFVANTVVVVGALSAVAP